LNFLSGVEGELIFEAELPATLLYMMFGRLS